MAAVQHMEEGLGAALQLLEQTALSLPGGP